MLARAHPPVLSDVAHLTPQITIHIGQHGRGSGRRMTARRADADQKSVPLAKHAVSGTGDTVVNVRYATHFT